MESLISRDELMQSVQRLSDLGQKLSGSPQEALACDYITDKLSRYGLDFEVQTYEGYISHGLRGRVDTMLAGETLSLPAEPAGFSAGTPDAGVCGRLVSLSDAQKSDLAAQDLDGAIVLVDGTPNYDLGMQMAAAGALAGLFVSCGKQRHKTQATALWGSPAIPEDLNRLLPIPLLSINQADGRQLAALGDGSRVTVLSQVETAWRSMRLPVARIGGRRPGFLLAGAHYCTWDKGSTDNVAGAALLLEMARLFHARRDQLCYGLQLAWWPGHEQGAYAGSSAYADRHWLELHRHAIAYLNVDIVGTRGASLKVMRNHTGELAQFSHAVLDRLVPQKSEEDAAFAARALRREDKYLPADRLARNSDQSFAGIGLSALQVSSFLPRDNPDHLPNHGLAWWWQSAYDDVDCVGPDELLQDARIHEALIEGLITRPVLPWRLQAVADDFAASLREYREAWPENEDLARLGRAIEDFDTLASQWDAVVHAPGFQGNDGIADSVALLVTRRLNPVLYHRDSAYDFDRTRRNRSLPGLAGALTVATLGPDARRMLAISLRRACNRVAHALNDAQEALITGLARLRMDENEADARGGSV
ncbi:MAG: M28 family peptidase [Castellaniella sp.]